MKCMYAQTRPRFILSSEGVFGGMEFEPMLTPGEKSPLPKMSPEEDRTRDAVDSEPKHYQLSYSGPKPADFTAFEMRHDSYTAFGMKSASYTAGGMKHISHTAFETKHVDFTAFGVKQLRSILFI